MIPSTPPYPLDLTVTIHFPEERGTSLLPWRISIKDFVTGKLIDTISAIRIIGGAGNQIVWAELEMYADEEGKPILSGPPVLEANGLHVKVGVFTAHVMRIRSGESFTEGREAATKELTGQYT